MDRVLITGGNGFIGSHLAELLLDQGDDVTLFDTHFNSNTAHLSCTKIRGDVRHYSRIKQAVVGQDAVFHFAAVSRVAWGQLDPYTCWRTNQLGTLNVLEACRKAKTSPVLFYASSREVYGEPKYFPVDEAHPKAPLSIYGMTKLCAERACRSYADPSLSRPIKSVIFRFSNVYGSERDLPERVIPKFMRKALRGEDITLYGGEQVLDFTFIDDTIQGILRAYAASMDGGGHLLGQEFHFVTGRGVSVSDLAGMIIALTGSSAQIVLGPANNFDVRKFVGSPAKSHKLLGYKPKVTLEEGLKRLRDRTLSSAIKTVASAAKTASIGA
ncbi:MAG: NAD-dependent epimerase/dehydratase family protein [Methanobacteriota archaeon]|nr:MAG: NAD-dependent epimerase/dehydratase family protein [Euryarchaeota archaeon]TMA00294.1 MAG: NAD-dependent epimerase/dehydratase family protein [Euryarchaeota archaeon]